MSIKGTTIDNSPMESFHGILKKETLYNNDITNLEEYIDILRDWLLFYKTKRIKIETIINKSLDEKTLFFSVHYVGALQNPSFFIKLII